MWKSQSLQKLLTSMTYRVFIPVPKPASEKDLISTNSTCLRLNLLTWDSNGCPIARFTISVRSFEGSSWETRSADPVQPFSMCGLVAATWYHLKVIVSSAAGPASANYYFSTLTDSGGDCVFASLSS